MCRQTTPIGVPAAAAWLSKRRARRGKNDGDRRFVVPWMRVSAHPPSHLSEVRLRGLETLEALPL